MVLALRDEDDLRDRYEQEGTRMPRMVDAAIWVDAAAPALTWNRGEILDLLLENRANIQKHIVDADLVGMAIQTFMKTQTEWKGSSTELLEAVIEVVPEETRRQKEWPKAANTFTNKLRAAAPGLRMSGIEIVEGTTHGKTTWELHKIRKGKDPTHPTYPTSEAQVGCDGWDRCDDFPTQSYEAGAGEAGPNPKDIEHDRQEREAIQSEAEIDPFEIPGFLDQRTPRDST